MSNAGIGLRIVSARSAFANVLHVDLAVPLNAPADVRTVQDMVGLRAIAGRDPLLEFREDIDQLYARMLKVVAYNAVFSFFSYSP